MAHGVPTDRTVTRPVANTLGAFAGGLAVGTVSAVITTATALGEGVGTLVVTPFKSAGAAVEENSANADIKAGAQYGARAVVAAANPAKTMIE